MDIRFVALALLVVATSSSAMEGYYSSPTLHGDMVVFTAEGDLWIHQLGIEQAERLTTHPSLETQASISPDGEWKKGSNRFSGFSSPGPTMGSDRCKEMNS